MTLALHGEIAPYQQEEQVDVVDMASNQVAARVFIAETEAAGCGVLLESDARTPFAFLDTSGAVAPPGQAPPARRQISLCRASPNHFDPAGAPFGTIQAAAGSGAAVVTVQRGGHVFCTVHIDSGGHGRVVDERGAVLATCEATGPRQRTLQVAQHADYGLMLSAVVAALKLQG